MSAYDVMPQSASRRSPPPQGPSRQTPEQAPSEPSLKQTLAWLKGQFEYSQVIDWLNTIPAGKSYTQDGEPSYNVRLLSSPPCKLVIDEQSGTAADPSQEHTITTVILSEIDPHNIENGTTAWAGDNGDSAAYTPGVIVNTSSHAKSIVRHDVKTGKDETFDSLNIGGGHTRRPEEEQDAHSISDRIAKALAHAATLCGAEPEPF